MIFSRDDFVDYQLFQNKVFVINERFISAIDKNVIILNCLKSDDTNHLV